MGERLLKPYEISVWEDQLTQNGFIEKKLAVIGANTMTGYNKVYNPVFNKKSNGEKTLSFSLRYKYFDPYSGNEDVVNPFAALLINERKVKLHYDNQWYEFIIKDHTESSDGLEWTYTCTDAFVLELSKNGYNITFDAELNNNRGTAAELVQETLKNTDWQLGEADVGRQFVAEPIYKAELLSTEDITIENTDGTAETVSVGNIYLFYSYVKNKNGKFVQFIINDENRQYTIDDNNVITDTNFRIINELEFQIHYEQLEESEGNPKQLQWYELIDSVYVLTTDEEIDVNKQYYKINQGFWLKQEGQLDQQIILINEIETKYQANRLVYNQLTTYDPVMGRTVNIYKLDDREIYEYTDYTYTTSNVVTNFITNGENFNVLEDGTLQGWNPYTEQEMEYNPMVRPSGNPSEKGWYELIDNEYVLTEDTEVNDEKTYYKKEPKAVNDLELITHPELGTGIELADISVLSQIEGFLKVQTNGPITEQYQNTVYNSGIENNASTIQSISLGQKFVFRWRAGVRKPNESDVDISDLDCLVPYDKLGLIVARYTRDEPTRFGYYYRYIDPNGIILRFENQSEEKPPILNNIIRGGTLQPQEENPNKFSYVINDVVQIPSTKYIYEVVENETTTQYVYNGSTGTFEEKNDNNYLPYYYLTATAQKAVSNSDLQDPTQKFGIFIYNTDTPATITREPIIDTIEGTAIQTDAGTQPITVTVNAVAGTEIDFNYTDLSGQEGRVSFACVAGDSYSETGEENDYEFVYDASNNTITFLDTLGFSSYIVDYTSGYENVEGVSPVYIQDIQLINFIPDGADETQPILMGNIPTATSNPTHYYYLKPADNALAEDITTYTSLEELERSVEIVGGVYPVYNENSEKRLSISASQSNCFNILQTIAETFECWIDLSVVHDARGYIERDEDGRPRKYVYLRQYAGKDNYAGFKYGINLNSIERTINSDEIVTKLIVDQSQSEYADEGFISISNASSNQSGESYILNFEYFYNQGLLNREEVEEDRLAFIEEVARVNLELQKKEKQRRDLEASLVAIGAKRNSFTELIETAQDTQSRALAEFEELTGQSYEEYREKHGSLDEDDQLTEEDTIFTVLGELYVSSATINNYVGILTNIEQEYWSIRKKLRGSENYDLKIWVDTDINQQKHIFVELSDYLPGFKFTVDSDDYESTVSKKRFDIEIGTSEEPHDYVMTFTAPEGYTVEVEQYTVDDSLVKKIKITCDTTIEGVEDEIDALRETKEQLVNDFNNKYSRFIQEGTWNSTDYIDSELYYLDALQVSNTSAQPTVSYTINVVEVSELEGLEWYLFDAGDKTYVEDTEFFGWADLDGLTPAREEVIVSEVEWHLDEPDQNIITVQNYKTRFEDLFQRISATVQTVQYNEATYAKISSLLDANGTINQDVLLQSLNNISGKQVALTSNGSVIINDDVILVQNLNNPANRVIINSEGIRISSDGGQTWRTAIDGQGINIGTVYTGMLNTNSVVIGSEDNPSFRWDKSGISAYRSNSETGIYDLQTYVRYDEYGLYGVKEGGSFKAKNLDDVLDKAHFAVTWDGFFIKNSYDGGGRVEITSDNDFRVLKTNDIEKVKIGALEWEDSNGQTTTDPTEGVGAPTLYGIRIKNDAGAEVLKTGDDGNLTITGTINANAGNFDGLVTVGQDENDNSKPYIIIDGRDSQDATISSSKYVQDGASYGWMINADGDAVFNNITARGAIKTAVFEYAEIQAVGGVFIFRPSSTIRDAIRVGNTDDVQITLEKPYLFKVGDWCKVSNYTNSQNEPIATSILSGNGLTHVYQIKAIDPNDSKIVILEDAYAALTSGQYKVVNSVSDLIGGALIDMGDKANGDGKVGNNNYGIGINSSDNVVNLPARAISLFETIVNENTYPKVSYKYRGILGTLPLMDYQGNDAQVNNLYHNYLEGQQGIYTDNLYIGDAKQYITFYTDNQNNKHLRINAQEIVFGTDDTTGEEITWDEHIDEQIPIRVEVESSNGNMFLRNNISTQLTCTVYKGNDDITDTVTRFNWSKKNSDGTIDPNWSRLAGGRTITISNEDVASKAIFTCTVEF